MLYSFITSLTLPWKQCLHCYLCDKWQANMASVITGTDDMKAQCTLWIHESNSAVVVRRKFISKHPHFRNNIPSRKDIRTWYIRFTRSGRHDTEIVHRGRPLIVEALQHLFSSLLLWNYWPMFVGLWDFGGLPNRLENHLMKLDVIWHTVNLGFLLVTWRNWIFDRRLN